MNEQTIFLTALDKQAPAERSAWLDQVCGADVRLRSRIDALLAQHESAGDFLESPPITLNRPSSVSGRATSADPHLPGAAITDPLLDTFLQSVLTPTDQPDCLGTLRQYTIREVIGRGAMGVVLRGYDTKLNRTVAIKILAQKLALDPQAKERFLREARAAAAITHPHVVTIHAVDEDRIPFLVMEFVDGRSLEDKIKTQGPLDLKEILRIGSQLASGLAAAHQQGLIHRDIKPANILLENGVERVKITDFGLARAVEDDMTLSREGSVSGTPPFMSPEQARGVRLDHRSDLFSLGSVLYAMCTGQPPFGGNNLMAVIQQVVNEEPPSIDVANHQIPEWLCDIISRLHAKNPDDRFQSAAEVANLLESHLLLVQRPQVDVHRPPARLRSEDAPTHLLPAQTKAAAVSGWTWFLRAAGLLAAMLLISACLFLLMMATDSGFAPSKDQDAAASMLLVESSEPMPLSSLNRIVDDRDDGYHETQSEDLKPFEGWQSGSDLNAQRAAYGHSYRFNNHGAMTATWTVTDLPPGEYDVFMTWPTGPQFQSIVSINLYDDVESLRSLKLNMSVAPVEHPGSQRHDGTNWALLDSVRADSGTLRVELDARVSKRISNDRGGSIACDAVWVRARE